MVHLHTRSWYSFLAGASSPDQLVRAAAADGQRALALTDLGTLAGAAQFAHACRQHGLKPLFGAEIMVDEYPLVFLCADREGYANLCDLLTLAHHNRLQPALALEQFRERSDGILCLSGDRWGRLATTMRHRDYRTARRFAERLKALFPERCFIELTHHQRPGDNGTLAALQELADTLHLPTVAANGVRHATAAGYALYDALLCAGLGLTVHDPHPWRPVNAQAYLRSQAKMKNLGFATAALANCEAIADLCVVDLLPEKVTPPEAYLPDGESANAYLERLCREALKRRYANRGYRKAQETLQRELSVIFELELAEFFLVVREVVQHARSCGIRCAGRGSAANSIVAYLLDITQVDPVKYNLVFERFLHTGRRGMPDIDVDFESRRRAEVIDWMHRRFSEKHTAMTANVITFRLRLAVREMGKVLGYPLPLIDRLTKLLPRGSVCRVRDHHKELALLLGESPLLESLEGLVERLHDGFEACPRHLSLHSGGMVLSRRPLRYISPIQTSANGVRQLQFNKDDVERLGLIKFDILGLRMLSTLSETLELLEDAGETPPDFDTLPLDDEETFKLIRAGKTLGVFQIESPGQWNLLSRSQPQNFADLIAQIALFRPGPLQGNMVHPFTQRRLGKQKIEYPHPSLEKVLKDTYGVILYQEQVLDVVHHFAGLTLTESDEFRRLMSRFREPAEMENLRKSFVNGAKKTHRDVDDKVANGIFDLVSRFVGYGFCRSHAAAFAQTVYISAYLKTHYPAAYMAGVLEHKPGFYPMHTLLEEARACGVRMLPVDIVHSDMKYRLERLDDGALAIRLPFTQVQEVSSEMAAAIVLERATQPFENLEDIYRRVAMPRDVWESLARAGVFDAFEPRRRALWRLGLLARRLGASGGDRLNFEMTEDSEFPALARLTLAEMTDWNFQTAGMSTGPHPIAQERPYLNQLGIVPIGTLQSTPPGRRVVTSGVVIARQRPPTAKGMVFLILEDESGRLPTAVTPPVYEKYHRLLRERGLIIEGRLEDAGAGQHGPYRSVLIQRAWPLAQVIGAYHGGYSAHPGQMAR